MRYFEVTVADSHYHSSSPLVYSYEERLAPLSVVTVPLRNRNATGFVVAEVDKPGFATREIKSVLSETPLPAYCLSLAQWLQSYYQCTFSEALRQFAPSKPTVKRTAEQSVPAAVPETQLELDLPLTKDQQTALDKIRVGHSTTTLLHGDTGTGKTRVYLELAQETLATGRSVIILTPEIALTAQLALSVKQQLTAPTYTIHSQLSDAQRKKIWFKVLESTEPVVILGPRSALFSPVRDIGLIILDEAHEPAYKQEQSPRYHAVRVASQLGSLTSSKVVLGTATPNITDYYLAEQHRAIIGMKELALKDAQSEVECQIVDLKKRSSFGHNPYISNQLIDAIKTTLSANKQVMLYLNRRGSARLILCSVCGWQLLCPNCDIPLIYHGDSHSARCHICGYEEAPPPTCMVCNSPDVIYKSIGTKALADTAARLFPQYRIQRFDSDNLPGERAHDVYQEIRAGQIDILIGTQAIAKGFDLPKLGLIGIVSAETALALPDFTSEERAFQLLYQVMGRVGRGHGHGRVIIQSYEPGNIVLQAAISRDWQLFYSHALKQRQEFRFPPFSYLLRLVCRRATLRGVEQASTKLKNDLLAQNLAVEIVGPAPSFYARRGRFYYWQLVVKSKDRDLLTQLAQIVPADWTIDLDPVNLL